VIGYERGCVRTFMRARRVVLGDGAEGKPRLLVRVDEFPHFRAWDEPGRFGAGAFRRFHEILRSAGVPYLVATLPRVARSPLDPAATDERELDDSERATLEELRRDTVAFGLHGWCHRTRLSDSRRRSELAGLDCSELERLIERGREALAELGIEAPVFVPPFNRFDAAQYPVLARNFEVVCGGPETVAALGFRKTPVSLSDSVYMPSYPPLYGRAAEILPALRRLVAQRAAVWVPIVLHWGWELEDDWGGLKRLVPELARYATDWGAFLTACRDSTASVAAHQTHSL
jgi:hypothetical protein